MRSYHFAIVVVIVFFSEVLFPQSITKPEILIFGETKSNISGKSLSFQYSDMMDLIGFMRLTWDEAFRDMNTAILIYKYENESIPSTPPLPKKERIKVEALSLSVLLPNMKPYYIEDAAQWKVKGHGERVEISISDGIHRGIQSREMIEDYAEQGRRKKEPDKYGLVHYLSNAGDTFFTQDVNDQSVWIVCDKKDSVEYPSCKFESAYGSHILFEYYLSLRYLPQWRSIDQKLKKLFTQFESSSKTINDKNK